nr:protein BIG GRAIN 1-like B [Tanacetum cinerariifolium]
MSMSDHGSANGKTMKRSHVKKPKVAKKPILGKSVEDEEIASFGRACLVKKWMEMKANEKEVMARHTPPTLPEFGKKELLNNDPLFFSSGSSSSDSNFRWHSEVEVVKPKPSCFIPLKRPKHVKTSVSFHSAMKMQNEVQMFDDDQIKKNDHSGLTRSKTRALKIYASLKKVKQ